MPIGVFDSGIGGLTVLREITGLLPFEDTIYLGDTARVPYGTKSKETVIKYSIEIARFLIKYNIKILVVACNTASAYSLDELKRLLKIPVVGVIEPGARMAIRNTSKKRIGVIGTEGTIRSSSYVRTIHDIDPDVRVYTKACPLFVPLAEEGWVDNSVAELTSRLYLDELKDNDIDVLLLGCTHYPLLKPVISKVMGGGVALIDSAMATALEVKELLERLSLLKDNRKREPSYRFFVTDSPERFSRIGRNFFGDGLRGVEFVEIET